MDAELYELLEEPMNHERHVGIYNVPTYFTVGIAGAGGLGAATALTLAKMGVVQMTVWDGDTVSEENIPTQLHWRIASCC